jgi:hypothetical protein
MALLWLLVKFVVKAVLTLAVSARRLRLAERCSGRPDYGGEADGTLLLNLLALAIIYGMWTTPEGRERRQRRAEAQRRWRRAHTVWAATTATGSPRWSSGSARAKRAFRPSDRAGLDAGELPPGPRGRSLHSPHPPRALRARFPLATPTPGARPQLSDPAEANRRYDRPHLHAELVRAPLAPPPAGRTAMTRRHATGYIREIPRRDGIVLYATLKLPDGSQPQRRLGIRWDRRSAPPDGYLPLRQAEARLARMLAGENPEVEVAPSTLTFGAAVTAWLDRAEHVDQRRPSTLRDYRGTANTILLPHFGATTPLQAITRREVQAFADALARAGHYSPRTRQKALVLLGRIFKVAQIEHDHPTNPVVLVSKGTVPAGEVVYFTHAEVALIAEQAEADDADLFIVMSRIGHRRGEIVAVRSRDVDFDGQQVHIRRNYVDGHLGTPKDHEIRTTSCSPP